MTLRLLFAGGILAGAMMSANAVEVGINDGPASGNWNIVLTAECATYDALQAYSAHPEHLACVAIIKPYIAERACVDYTVAD